MNTFFRLIAVVVLGMSGFTGCGSAYTKAVSASGLGSQEYRPAVYVEPGMEGKYQRVLGICRTAAHNRQLTAAQEAQLATITGTAESTIKGAGMGAQFGQLFKMAGLGDVSIGEAAGLGAGIGLLSGLASSAGEGAKTTARQTKRALLLCLQKTSQNGQLWTVLE